MEKFKVKDLMITLNPSKAKHIGVYDCEQSTKPDDGTNCTSCTHNTTTLETNCTSCTHVTAGDETCTSCTHNTATTCIPHSKPVEKHQLSHTLKAIELEKLKKTIARMQETEYA
jgi:hypothetical protein